MRYASFLLLLLGATVIRAQDVRPVQVLFRDLRDAAGCLEMNVDDCTTITNKKSTFEVARWVGYIYCKEETIPSCADCYGHIDGVNVVGVIPVVTEKVFEPVLCASTRFQNHSSNLFPKTTSLAAEQRLGTVDMANWSRKVTKEDLLATAGIDPTVPTRVQDWTGVMDTVNGTPVTVPVSLATAPLTVSGGPKLNIPLRSMVDVGQWSNKTIVTEDYVNRSDPILPASGQTALSNNYVQAVATARERVTGTFDATGLDKMKLCGISYQVQGYGSVHDSAYQAYAHVITRARTVGIWSGTSPADTGNSSWSVDVAGNTVAVDTFDSATGMWRCMDVRAVNVAEPAVTNNARLPSTL